MERDQQGQVPSPVETSSRYYDLAMPERWLTRDGFLATDLYETDTSYVIQVAVPGVSADQLTITRVGDTVTVEGQVKSEASDESNYVYRELSYGRFQRSFVLPRGAEDDLGATLEAGVLSLEFAKRQEQAARSIKVTSVEQSPEEQAS